MSGKEQEREKERKRKKDSCFMLASFEDFLVASVAAKSSNYRLGDFTLPL